VFSFSIDSSFHLKCGKTIGYLVVNIASDLDERVDIVRDTRRPGCLRNRAEIFIVPIVARPRSGITPVMSFLCNRLANVFVTSGALFVLLCAPLTDCAASSETAATRSEPVTARFRGCEAAGWCRFWIESMSPRAQSLHRVYPDGVPRTNGDDVISLAVRDRLNALLASMVHQHKRIVLHDLREVGDGMFAATVTVNEADLASDLIVLELGGKLTGTTR